MQQRYGLVTVRLRSGYRPAVVVLCSVVGIVDTVTKQLEAQNYYRYVSC